MRLVYYAKKMFHLSLCLVFLGSTMYGMEPQEPSVEQLAQGIKNHYHIDSCDQYLPNLSVKGLYNPSLLWATDAADQRSFIDRDIIFQIIGCKDIAWYPDFKTFLNPTIADYIFHKNSPIKIISIENTKTNAETGEISTMSETVSYRNTPEAEKKAFLFVKYLLLQKDFAQANHYLMGYLLGYSDPDIQYFYGSTEKAAPHFKIIIDAIILLHQSFKLFERHPHENFVILPHEISALGKRIDDDKAFLQQYGSSVSWNASDIHTMETLYDKIRANTQSHESILQELLDRLAQLKNEYTFYLNNVWPQTESYKDYQEDKAKAQTFLEENKNKSVEQLKSEVEALSGNKIQDVLSILRKIYETIKIAPNLTIAQLIDQIKQQYSITSCDDLIFPSPWSTNSSIGGFNIELLSLLIGCKLAVWLGEGTQIRAFLDQEENIYVQEIIKRLTETSQIQFVGVQIKKDYMALFAYRNSSEGEHEFLIEVIKAIRNSGLVVALSDNEEEMAQLPAPVLRKAIEEGGFKIQQDAL